jgi:hypothetical protein
VIKTNIEVLRKPNGKYTVVIVESDEDGDTRRSPGVNEYDTQEQAEEARAFWASWLEE